ncbi:AAA family ATPase [Chitinilyticum litopenaei]|uniref:AAA family ATPase n=1 Tax=Chitinilyticum litopenaei TaxID=1121276 RepID=UPI000404BE74|nr:AAA family ATPase [Chitinilyticum litopenaei]
MSGGEGAGLQLWLCGAPRLLLGEADISAQLRYRKAWALLAILACAAPAWQARGTLASLLWPDLPDAAALGNLRQVLSNLARVFNSAGQPPWLDIERQRLRLRVPACGWLDVTALLALGEEENGGDAARWARLERVLPQCLGELLEGSMSAEGEAFAAWLGSARLRLQRARLAAMQRLITQQLAAGRDAAAVLVARLRWQIDPLGEESAASLMRLLLQLDDRRGAEQVAAELERNLRSELGLRPGEQIRALLRASTPTALPQAVVPASITVEQRTLLLLFVALPSTDASDAADAGLTTLLAARALLDGLQAGPLPLRGRGFWVAFGEQDGAEQMLARALQAVRELLQALPQRLCLGLAIGPVICRVLPDGIDWFGAAPERAWLLAHRAQPGEVLADAELAARLPDWQAIGAGVWRWQAPVAVSPLAGKARLPMVARQQQLDSLRAAWAQACAGAPSWVAVVGEPGVGKTRLAQALIEALPAQSALVLHLQCSHGQQRQPLAPLRRALLQALGDTACGGEALEARLLARWPGLAAPELAGPVWSTLLHFLQAEADEQALADGRNELFWALCLMVDALSSQQPLLLWIDDLHWADLATREWWSHYAGLLAQQPVLLLSTARHDQPLAHLAGPPQRIELAPLAEAEAAALARLHAAQAELPPPAVAQIVRDSGGVPLFVEFLTRRHLDGSTSPAHPAHGLLTREMDRLGPFKAVLQSAAVLGQRFCERDLARLLPKDEPAPVLELACHYRLLRPVGEGCYEFRHALIRDAAYQGLPPGAAQRLHGQHGDWLATRSGAPAAEVAGHFEQARRWPEAIRWWQRAGELALNAEFAGDALVCFRRAQGLLPHWPQAGAVLARQLGFAVGKAALLSEGYGSEQGHRQYEALVRDLADEPQAGEDLFRALSGLYMGGSSLGRTEGLIIAERLRPLADTPAKRLMLCFAMGNSLFWRGRFAEAKGWQQEGIALAASLPADERARYWGEDLGILLRAFLCWNAWFLGEPQLAASTAADGIALARAGGKPHALCFMLAFAAAERWSADDAAGAAAHALEGLTLGRHHGFPLWQGIHGLFALWSQARCGQLADLAPVLQAAAQFSQAYQAGTTTARWVVMSILLLLERRTELLALLPQTRAGIAQYEDEYCLSEVLLIEALLAPAGELAARLQDEAIALAHRQGAPGLVRRLQWLAGQFAAPCRADHQAVSAS